MTIKMALTGLACLAATFNPLAAQAQEAFPDKEIRIVIGFPAGSSTETSLRALAQVAGKYVNKPLVIVNKPGASQSIAFRDIATSRPDGYTIGVGTDGFRALTRYQLAVKDFDPDDVRTLVGYARFRHVLFVKGDSPYAKYEDYAAFAKSRKDAMDYGGTGEGTAPDLLGKLLFRELNTSATHVAYRGTNELIPAIQSGYLKSGINDVSILFELFKKGDLKPVLIFGDERIPGLDVPTSKEKGLSDVFGLFNSVISVTMHKDTPPDRAAILRNIFTKAAEDPDFKRQADTLGLQSVSYPAAVVEKRIADLRSAGIPLLKSLNLYKE